MGRVQSSFYNRQASAISKITNALPLGEGQTYYKHLNDIIRQLMADVREESDEVRSLIAGQNGDIATARSAATTAQSRANEAAVLASGLQSQITTAVSAAATASDQATAASNAASSASSAAASASATASAVELVANQNQSDIASLDTRVTALEDGTATGTGDVQTDGVSVTSTNGVLHAIDIAVGGETSDLASARGQLGRTAITSAESLDGLVLDGWYAFGSGTSGKPEGIVEGVLRVSSSHTSGTTFQSVFAAGSETARVFWRSTTDGANWTAWSEPIASGAIGDGLSYEDGVLDVVFPDVLPTTEGTDPSYVLTAGGTWDQRATPEQISQLASGLAELESGLAALQERVDGYVAVSAIEPDGTTVAVVDGQYSVPLYFGASTTEDGIAGLVPPADAGDLLFLRSDGQWADPVLASVPTFDGSTEGTVPLPGEDEDGFFLRSDGQWADPLEELEPRVQALEDLDVAGFSERIGDLELDAQNVASQEDIDAIFAEPESMGG